MESEMTSFKPADRAVSVRKIYNITDHWFPDKIGGSCLYAYRLHRLLSQHVDTETITLVGPPSIEEQDLIVHKVLRKAHFLHNRKVIRELARQDDAVWVVHSPWMFLHLFFALQFSVRNRVVGVYHGPWYLEYYNSAAAARNIVARIVFTLARYLIEVFYALYVKRFIFLSSSMYRMTTKYLPVSASRVRIVPMWSEKTEWDPPRPKHEPFVLTTFRRLEPRMGLQDFLLALHRCDLDDYRLIICGDGPYRKELQRLIGRYNLQDRVELRGWVTEEEKDALIRQSAAVVIPSSRLEGFSLLALESLEQGTPLLVTEAVGFCEYIREIPQDYVKIVDLTKDELRVRDFLSMGNRREGLDLLQSRFDAERIRNVLISIILPQGEQAVTGYSTAESEGAVDRAVSRTRRQHVLHEV